MHAATRSFRVPAALLKPHLNLTIALKGAILLYSIDSIDSSRGMRPGTTGLSILSLGLINIQSITQACYKLHVSSFY
jgi:hypothetical protein